MVAKIIFMTKTFRSYSTNYLRYKKVFAFSGVPGPLTNCGLACRVLASALEGAAGFAGRT